jgi:hypothetical protein
MILDVLVKKQEASKRKKKRLFNILEKMMKIKGKKLA